MTSTTDAISSKILYENILAAWTEATRYDDSPLDMYLSVPSDVWADLVKLEQTVSIEGWPRILGLTVLMGPPGSGIRVVRSLRV